MIAVRTGCVINIRHPFSDRAFPGNSREPREFFWVKLSSAQTFYFPLLPCPGEWGSEDADLLLWVDTWGTPPRCRPDTTGSPPARKVKGGIGFMTAGPSRPKFLWSQCLLRVGDSCPLHPFDRTEISPDIESGRLHCCSAGPEETSPDKSLCLGLSVGRNHTPTSRLKFIIVEVSIISRT